MSLQVLSLFDGISVGNLVLKEREVTYFSSEIDANAIQVSQQHFPSQVRLGNVCNICPDNLPPIDLLIGGSPCQSFSQAGLRTGFEGKSGLFFEYVRLLKALDPTFFFLENVKMKGEWRDRISEELGVEPVLINSNAYSAQNRPRYYWFNWNFTPPTSTKPTSALLGQCLDKVDLAAQCFTERRTEEAKQIRREYRAKYNKDFSPRRGKELVLRTDGKANCLTATISNKEHKVMTFGEERMLTVSEWERLQGLPVGFTKVNALSDAQRMRLIGNSWQYDTVLAIFSAAPFWT